MQTLKEDALAICMGAIEDSLPDAAVRRALAAMDLSAVDRVVLIALGKAAWQMANAAYAQLGARIARGVVITKYQHSHGPIGTLEIYEAGHPVPDENGLNATRRAMDMVEGLTEKDRVILLISGGGSSLFERPLVSLDTLMDVTGKLLASGADITEMNTIRKRLSAVKGGRFAQLCAPARVHAVILSDIIGDPPGMIASGPAYPDASTCAQALALVEKYALDFSPEVMALLHEETPKTLDNAVCEVTGGVRRLCQTAARLCVERGYKPVVLTSSLDCEAREAGAFLAAIARDHQNTQEPLAYIACGETVVTLRGKGRGGRNQELALAAARGIADIPNAGVISVGSDGTDGPTDAAGGYTDGDTLARLKAQGVDIHAELRDNNAYYTLQKADGLILTGATGTNVNDVALLLIRAREG